MVEIGMKTVSKLLGITESPIDIKAKVFNFSFYVRMLIVIYFGFCRVSAKVFANWFTNYNC